MEDRAKYLKSLKKELEKYKKELLLIQKEFKGKTGGNIEIINQSLQNILQESIIAYEKLEAASTAEWEPLKAITNNAFNNLRAGFHAQVNLSRRHVKEYADHVERNYHEQIECVSAYVKQHPIKSLVLAVGAGFIIGKLLK